MNTTRQGQHIEPFVSNFVMMVRLRGELEEEMLQKALGRMRYRHPALFPRGTENCSPIQVYPESQEDDWRGRTQEELNQAFPTEGPFARLVLLPRKGKTDILATFHHGICDGFSGVYFLRDLLLALGQEEPLPPLATTPRLWYLIPDSIRDNRQMQWRVRWEALRIRLMSRILQRGSSLLQHPFPSRADSDKASLRQTYVLVVHSLETDQTQAVLDRCHQERVTVHAAICTAWLRAWRRLCPARRKQWFSVSSPVSLRHRLPSPPPESAGMFMTTVVTRQKYREDFWQMAREFNRRLQRDCREDKLFLQPLLLQWLFAHCSERERGHLIHHLFGGPVPYDFSITNLGQLNLPLQVGRWQVEAFVNVVNSSPYERTVGVNTVGGRMTFVLASRASLLSQEQAEFLMNRAIEELTEAIENNLNR